MALPIDPFVLVPAVAALLIAAAISDIRRFIIPNWISVALAALFVARLAAAGADGLPLMPMLLAPALALAVLVAGAGAFHAGWLGGGDVKLMAATALWIAPARLPDFLVLTVLIGGVLAMLAVGASLARRLTTAGHPTGRTAAPIRLPYGVAIAAAGILVLFDLPPL